MVGEPRAKHGRTGLAFAVTLVVTQLLDLLTAESLSLVDLVPSHFVDVVGHAEVLLGGVTWALIVGCHLAWRFADHNRYCQLLTVTTGFSMVGLVLNVVGLVGSLLDGRESAAYLLLEAVLVHTSNILTFTVWYWLLDHGSQASRALGQPTRQVLVFPQNAGSYEGHERWQPDYVAYLFLAFNTSNTFGPTETLPLTSTAKLAMMGQVAISLVVLLILAARAIGLLQ
jgi:hypothetical protein